jgi:glycosyltransferase involved in cell wall biosynthesis
VHGLARALVELGHEVHVFTTNVDGPAVSSVPLHRPVDFDGVNVWYFPVTQPRRIFRAPALGKALVQAVRRSTVLHLHSVFLWPTWAAARAARRAGVPYIVAPRGMLIKDLIAQRSRIAKSAWIRLIERVNIEHAAAIHMTSHLEATELERFGWKLPPVAVVPNGIDEPLVGLKDTTADIESIVSQQPLVLFFGRLSWKKGLDRLLLAFARHRTGKLAIVGPDDEGLAPQLARQAEQLGISERVRILPRAVIGGEKERLFAAARLFVLPSYSENFGNTVLEAMRRGVPVVVTPEVGAAEIVRKSGGGVVVAGEAESFGAEMHRLIDSPDLARSMGEAGQRHAISYYSWPCVAKQMEKVYIECQELGTLTVHPVSEFA